MMRFIFVLSVGSVHRLAFQSAWVWYATHLRWLPNHHDTETERSGRMRVAEPTRDVP